MTKHWSDFHSVNPSNSHSLNLVTLPLNPTVTSYINSARSAARSTAEVLKPTVFLPLPFGNTLLILLHLRRLFIYLFIYLFKLWHPRCVQII